MRTQKGLYAGSNQVTIKQTPATRPSESEPTGDSDTLVKVAEPFTIPFDKLIIAVGAYSQSTHFDRKNYDWITESL